MEPNRLHNTLKNGQFLKVPINDYRFGVPYVHLWLWFRRAVQYKQPKTPSKRPSPLQLKHMMFDRRLESNTAILDTFYE